MVLCLLLLSSSPGLCCPWACASAALLSPASAAQLACAYAAFLSSASAAQRACTSAALLSCLCCPASTHLRHYCPASASLNPACLISRLGLCCKWRYLCFAHKCPTHLHDWRCISIVKDRLLRADCPLSGIQKLYSRAVNVLCLRE